METKKTAVVTGANRGIGLEICRQLARAGFAVLLTARNAEKGEEAANALKAEGLDVKFHVLDVASPESVAAFGAYMKNTPGRLDVLVNNAGILINSRGIEGATIDDLQQTFATNVFGPFMLVKELMPLLTASPDARIINLSSGMGAFNEMGGGHIAYRMSKTALNSLTVVLASDFAHTGVKVYSMCPGWVKTGMGGAGAPRSVEKGADTAFWLATEKNIPSGGFYRDRKLIKW